MRTLTLFTGAAVVAVATLLAPTAHAQLEGRAGGACGPAQGSYELNNAHASDFPGGGETVPALFYKVDYSGLSAPTTIGVIRYYNDLHTYQGVSTFTVQNPTGTVEGVLRAPTDPEAQGGEGSLAPASGRADGPVTSQRTRGGAGASGYGGGGGLMPGEYIFHVYTGEIQQTPDGPRFATSPSGYLGEFACGVQD